MKTVMEFLQERREMASHNLYCYSATYAMDKPKEGCETQFAEAFRDCEIVDELIAMVERPTYQDDVYPAFVLRQLVLDLAELLKQKPLPIKEITILNDTIKALTPMVSWSL